MGLSELLFHFFLGASPMEENQFVTPVTDATFSKEVLASPYPTVVLYAPSCKRVVVDRKIERQIRYTERAFAQSARDFRGILRFIYLDLETCAFPGQSEIEIDAHIFSRHNIYGFPTVVLYHSGSAITPYVKELTRIETAVPSQSKIQRYRTVLNYIIYHDLVVQDALYTLSADGFIVPLGNQ